MEQITITRGLSELKLIDARIKTSINSLSAIDVFQGRSPNKAMISGKTLAEFEADANSKYKSITDLIERRSDIKSAIMRSNSVTEVLIGGTKMTVADAIEFKTVIGYQIELLNRLKVQYSSVRTKIETNRVDLEKKVEAMITQSLGTDKKTDKSMYDTIAGPMFDANELKMVDPLQLEKLIEKSEKAIFDFTSEVDFILSESNARTSIEI